MPKVKARNLLLAMVLAGKGEFNSTERLDEEMKIIRLIHKVDRYLGGRKGKYDLNPEG